MERPSTTETQSSATEGNFGTVALIAVAGLVGLAAALLLVRFYVLANRVLEPEDINDDMVILARAEDAVRSAELILSFLEGAAVLVTVAFGAAALYGLRQTRELREDFDKRQKEFDDKLRAFEEERQKFEQRLRDDLDKMLKDFDRQRQEIAGERRTVDETLAEISGYKPQLADLARLEDELEKNRATLVETINDVAFLLQADQEFRLRNFDEAYEFSRRTLEHDPDNLLALYITGWMETHHIRGRLDGGIQKLKKAVDRAVGLELKWPTARAAYGVSLRRKGMSLQASDPKAFASLLLQAEGELKAALGLSNDLVDFNKESFWGTVGGILRDLGRHEEAIEAYDNALKVTSGSSYPQGNLAALRLYKASRTTDLAQRAKAEQQALDEFDLADQFARAELAQAPNDFFLLMDIAMSNTVLVRRDARRYRPPAKEFFERARRKSISDELLAVNIRGWQFLLDSCPDGEVWDEIRLEIETRLSELRALLDTLQNSGLSASA